MGERHNSSPSDGILAVQMSTTDVKGICTKCQQELVRDGDLVKCPVCGESISVNLLEATQRLKVPYPSLYNNVPRERRKGLGDLLKKMRHR